MCCLGNGDRLLRRPVMQWPTAFVNCSGFNLNPPLLKKILCIYSSHNRGRTKKQYFYRILLFLPNRLLSLPSPLRHMMETSLSIFKHKKQKSINYVLIMIIYFNNFTLKIIIIIIIFMTYHKEQNCEVM